MCVCGKSYYNLIVLSNPFPELKRERGNNLNWISISISRHAHSILCQCCICIFIFWWWRIGVALGCDNKLHTNFNFHALRSLFNSSQCIIPGVNRRNSCLQGLIGKGDGNGDGNWFVLLLEMLLQRVKVELEISSMHVFTRWCCTIRPSNVAKGNTA